MAFASLILIALAASVLIVTCAASHTKSTSSATSYSYTSSRSKRSSSSRQKCVTVKKCPKNEEFSICTQCIGRAQYCSQKGQKLWRLKKKPTCTEGCVCKHKFLRNYNGTCIPESKCSTDCGPDEVLDDCPVDCPSDFCPKSDERSLCCPRPDSDECPPPVCKCGFNRRRAENGTCILTRDCPPVDCSARPFEEYVACPPICPTDDCSEASENGQCPIELGNIFILFPCNPTCRCIKGYWRKNGICVPYDECQIPSSCPANEVVRCVDECPPETTCNTRGIAYRCMAPVHPCKHKCVCKEGYYRNYLGTCITNDECDQCSGVNEFFACDSACDNECSTLYKQNRTNCPIKNKVCNRQCYCEDGFARDKDGKCVPIKECQIPKSCPANEEVRCVDECRPEPTCKNRGRQCKSAAPVGPCKNKCVCKKGYYRNSLGTCIAKAKCDIPTSCPANEEVRCVNKCPPERNCNTRDAQYKCPAPVDPCENKCVCKKGYYRNYLGTCISNDECDKCPGVNEFFACDSACDNECSKIQTQNRTNCPIKNIVCNRKCYCKNGFARDKDGNCVPVEECPPPEPACGENEVLDKCPSDCPSDYCPKSAEDNRKCPLPNPCPPPKCKCRFNFRRSKNGTCIPTENCPPFSCKAKSNEEYTPCPPLCPSDECNLPRVKGECPFKIGIVLECNPKCQCKEGYGRVNGKCIPYKDCPDLCPVNEEYNSCTQAVCRNQNCTNKDGPVFCPRIDPAYCIKGCVCKENFYRNSNGTCVADDECDETPTSCPANEEVRCVDKCPPERTCKTRDLQYRCTVPVDPCQNKCVCKEGYYRNYLGTCITDKECDQCSGDNEFFSCGGACDNECSKLNKQNRTNCPIRNIVCNRRCYCEDGFARDKDGNCIPIEECPIPTSCPANEEVRCVDKCPPEPTCENRGRQYKCAAPVDPCTNKCVCKKGYYRNSQGTCVAEAECDIPTSCPANEEVRCVNKCPPERTCENRRFLYKCAVSVDPCQNKCVCKEGYYRNYLGTCITNDECDQCTGANEFFACDSACDNECSKIQTQNRTNCPIQNIVCNRQCYCKNGFARDKDGKCVPVQECPANTCPVNEEYVQCIQGVCRAMNCSQKGELVPCPDRKWPKEQCDAGCICKENYLRNEDGDCVPEDQCETQTEPTCGDNEVLDECPSDCPSDYCPKSADDNNKCPQPNPCPPPECKCGFNFRRSENGSCIPTRNCPPFKCKAKSNEEYNPCPPLCPSDECSLSRVKGVCPFRIGIVLECNPKCQCKEGYGRVNGKCIPYEDCPGLCPVNEEYNSCTQAVCRNQNCTNKDGPVFCPRIDPANCIKGCVCKENYYRNSNGTCVAVDDCDAPPKPTCGDNEVLDECPSDCPSDYCPKSEDDNKTCPQPTPCPPPKCKCGFNFRRSKNGTCISTRNCPPFKCKAKSNEEYTPCPPLCPSDECSLARVTGVCPFRIGIVLECNPKCQCKEGYGRVNGKCIPYEDCPDLCPVNEEYNSCTQAVCRNQNCTNKDGPVFCPRIDPANCIKGCVCKENFYRNSNGTCVAVDDCDAPPKPTCGDNEVLDECPSDCPSDYCPKSEDDNKTCPQPTTCPPPKCKCGFNFRRSDNGTCIPTRNCPPFKCKAKSNEEYTPCPPLCPSDECSLARVTGVCPFRIGIVLECNPKCQCKEGYGRVNGKCIPYEDCPGLCPVNEEYNSCTQAVCRNQNCTNKDGPVLFCPKTDPANCIKGCVCKKNYYRNSNGTCVAYNNCDASPEPTCGDNEVLDKCPSDCASDHCPKSEDDNKTCPQPTPCPPPKCKCSFNFRRSDNGTCIPTRNCPPFKCKAKSNEEYTPCPPLCPSDECSLPRVKGVCPYKIGIVLECNPKCQCKEGYGRVNGKCIPYEDCPGLCPVNEEYNSCTQAVCRNQNCTNKDGPVLFCPKTDPANCIKGCVCKKNYYRNSNGTCVAYDDCDASPEPTCGDNEVLDKCPSDCASDYCPKSADDNKKCPQPNPCPPPKCKCRFNFRRSDNGTCIPTRNCPPFKCKAKSNEEYTPCPPLCPSDECSLPRVKGVCPYKIGIVLECNPKCQCKEGYGRVNGKCIPYEDCPNLCPVNEEYNSCTQAVCRNQNCTNKDGPVLFYPKTDPSNCIKGCVCKKNYFRNSNGTCVAYDDCDDKRCPNPNEKYALSRQPSCPALGTCTSIVARIACDKPESLGCICKDGFLRDDKTSVCIPTCQCPQIASTPECQNKQCPNPNEKYAMSLEQNCPGYGSCRSLVERIPCDKPESFGCICENGYLRDDKTSVCIPTCKCPQMASAPQCQNPS